MRERKGEVVKRGLRDAWRRWELREHRECVFSAAFSPDGRLILSGSGDEQMCLYSGQSETTILLWDVDTGERIRSFRGHTDLVTSVAFSPGGTYALSGSLGTYDAHSLRLWEVKTGRCVRVLEPPPKSVSAVGFSADGHLALSAGMLDSGSKVWRFPEGDCIREFPSSWGTTDAKISADGQGVLFATGDELQLFEVATGDSARVCRGHSGGVKAAAFVGNSKALSGGGDQTLKLWDLEANRCLKTYEGHSSSVESVAVSSDERYALSGSEDGTAKLWDLDLGQCIWTFAGHTGSIKCVSFSPDDGFVLTASADRSLGVWVLDWEWNI